MVYSTVILLAGLAEHMGLTAVVLLTVGTPVGVVSGAVHGAAGFALLMLLAAIIYFAEITPVFVTGTLGAAAFVTGLGISGSSMVYAAIVFPTLSTPG